MSLISTSRTVPAAAIALALFAASPAFAAPAPESFASLAEKVTPAVVNISSVQQNSDDPLPRLPFDIPEGSPFEKFFRQFGEPGQRPHQVMGLGSGFIIDPEGYVVTNNHVIDEASGIKVTLSDGKQFDAKLLGADPQTDLALLKIDAKDSLPTVEWGDSDALKVGDWVMAVGNPFGLGGSVTAGIVSARSRDIHAGPFDDFLQVDASINQGNSGGPTFDLDGRVIGVNTAIASPNGGSVGIGFAIPSNLAKPIIEQLREKGQVERGWLGVQVQAVTPALASALGLDAPKGALVSDVIPDSPAERAGLKQGDVILGFGDREVEEMRDLPRIVAETPADKKVELRIWREGGEVAQSVTIARQDQRARQLALGEGSSDVEPGAASLSETLGATLAPLTAEMRQHYQIDEEAKGVVVTGIEPSGIAAEQGLREGDVIVSVNQEQVGSPEEVEKLAKAAKDDKKGALLLLVNREGSQLFVGLDVGRV
ncbi:MAG TPA: DegQ family serine endoprotease [Alphaproteobacteria bacterium]|nr:DegQ family serine endoprotease [Alphaproteobacteria bacterium]